MKTIKLNKELFDYTVIEKCIKDYVEIAAIQLTVTNDSYTVSIQNCCYDEQETAYEFENYVIEYTFRSQKQCL